MLFRKFFLLLAGAGPRGVEPAGIFVSPVGVEDIEAGAEGDISIPESGGTSEQRLVYFC